MLVCAGAVFADTLPSFEVASIKPAAPMTGGRIMIGQRGGPGTPDPGQIAFTNVSVKDLIQNAYNVKAYQISAPNFGWLETVRFDIVARVPAGATAEQARLMMQSLLADRFKLSVHHSSKDQPVYALLVAKNGPRLKESVEDPNAAAAPPNPAAPPKGAMSMMMTPGGRMRLKSDALTMSRLTDMLASQLDRPVIDATELTGKYDIVLDFAPDMAAMQAKMAAMGVGMPPGAMGEGGGHDAAGSGDSQNATLFTALPEQLGLRLESRKGPVDLIVVDAVERTPTEN